MPTKTEKLHPITLQNVSVDTAARGLLRAGLPQAKAETLRLAVAQLGMAGITGQMVVLERGGMPENFSLQLLNGGRTLQASRPDLTVSAHVERRNLQLIVETYETPAVAGKFLEDLELHDDTPVHSKWNGKKDGTHYMRDAIRILRERG